MQTTNLIHTLAANLSTKLTELQDYAAREASVSVLSGQPWTVILPDATMGVRIDRDGSLYFRPLRADLCGSQWFDRENAEKVAKFAALHPGAVGEGVRIVRRSELRGLQIATTEALLAVLPLAQA